MTKRYYYTDPLAAAWMAKYFGMKFIYKDGGSAIIGRTYGENSHSEGWVEYTSIPERTAYIHPDSEHILEPQVGDIVLNCDDNPARVIANGKECGWFEVSLDNAAMYIGTEAIIIQRNGIPFMWPEGEAV